MPVFKNVKPFTIDRPPEKPIAPIIDILTDNEPSLPTCAEYDHPQIRRGEKPETILKPMDRLPKKKLLPLQNLGRGTTEIPPPQG